MSPTVSGYLIYNIKIPKYNFQHLNDILPAGSCERSQF